LTIKIKPIRRNETYKERILIVDDDEIVAMLLSQILRREGFQTEVARDGMEGLEKIKRYEYGVIISDCEMPRMNGDKLYLEVQKLSQDLAKRIIFISGNINYFIRSTGNRFLSKPFSNQQLIKVVKDLLKSMRESDP
jgi:two-component system, OmpR family, response regulator VicR